MIALWNVQSLTGIDVATAAGSKEMFLKPAGCVPLLSSQHVRVAVECLQFDIYTATDAVPEMLSFNNFQIACQRILAGGV
mgnify:CR=1 FL=1